MVTTYLVLLFAVPSNLTIAALGSLGRPSTLWGLLLMLWWILTKFERRAHDPLPMRQPVRLAFGCLLVVALVSFAAALLRGQPADQVTPAMTSLLRLASWGGVLLVVMDGIDTHRDALRLASRIVLAGTLLSLLGIAQFATGESLLEWAAGLPGVAIDLGGVDNRGGFTRASGTATHPLEYTAAILAILPIAIARAVARGERAGVQWSSWVPVAAIAVAALLSVSRSAVIGLIIGVVALLPFLPRTYRWALGLGGGAAAVAVVIAVPGVLTTTLTLFTAAADDPSTTSRTDGLARVPDFLAPSPIIGQGFGTFLPRYYIFDNQWVLSTVELGVLGVTALAGIVVAAIVGAARARQASPVAEITFAAAATVASVFTIAVLFLFFDGLSFPIAAGLFFLLAGYSGALRGLPLKDAGARVISPAMHAVHLPGAQAVQRREQANGK
ncbi:O-antigen ligase [Agrococcus sp. TF02-05]|uniref:O-antigen ligase family protein n=1 Tax=Agrococcus sp. TF02-05 TaxID=2815211 RepID=UPI001AA17ED4|nr:O-antigen ligase family protein [Agrococcus sp. TF02-05]MBO1769110.1 O-antigen ligase family protein [Agrococcus sp. TF02-05]